MIHGHGTDGFIVVKNGLLWRNGKLLNTFEADRVARAHGFMYAERMIAYLEKRQKEK